MKIAHFKNTSSHKEYNDSDVLRSTISYILVFFFTEVVS